MYERDSNEFVSGLKVCGERWYSDTTASRLSVIEVETRVLKVCKAYDKVVADKVCTFYLFCFFIISDAYEELQCQATIDY